MEKIIVPYGDGISTETKGYVDITKIVEEAIKNAEQEIKDKSEDSDKVKE